MNRTDAGIALTGKKMSQRNAQFAGILERTNQVVTPQAIENRLASLSKEVDDAHDFLEKAEHGYHQTKCEFEIAVATERLQFSGEKLRVQDVQDIALSRCKEQYRALNQAEAVVKAPSFGFCTS